MEKKLTKVLTDKGIFETELSIKEAQKAVKRANERNELLALPLNGTAANLNIDGEMCPVVNDKITYLDLNEIAVVWYAENTYRLPKVEIVDWDLEDVEV